MEAVGKFYELVILNAVCFVYLAVCGVEALYCKALLGVKQEVVDFLIVRNVQAGANIQL